MEGEVKDVSGVGRRRRSRAEKRAWVLKGRKLSERSRRIADLQEMH